MARTALKNEPTAYPKGVFYTVRTFQSIASVVVAGEMFYFIYWLKHGGYKIPWMFFFLQGAALATLITLVVTGILRWRHRLSALLNGAINFVASALWIAGFGLLADAMSETIFDACVPALWGNQTGLKICRLYKLLFAASLLGMLATTAAFILDVVVYIRVQPGAQYSKANPLLEKDETAYTGRYEEYYDPHTGRKSPGIAEPNSSATALPYDSFSQSHRTSRLGA
jgi:hypothetical protein